MTASDWRKSWEVYEAACEMPVDAREEFVCRSLPEGPLRAKVFELLSDWDRPAESEVPPPPADPVPRAGARAGQAMGRFQLLSLIGAGGMGEVYRAFDPDLHRHVAVKLIAPKHLVDAVVVNLICEARAASALNHPGIVTVHEVIRSSDAVAIAMELVEGAPLRKLCGTPQQVERVMHWGRQIAEALAASHASGIVHRDIKPENLILRPDGYVKVLDFGLAAQRNGDKAAERHLPVGTLRYMSPEQARGAAVTAATDIFSLGIVLYELATGAHPFAPHDRTGESELAVVDAIVAADFAEPSRGTRLPRQLRALLAEMLQPDAALRPTSAEVAKRLHAPARGRGRWFAVGGVAAACALFAALWVWRPVAGPLKVVQGTLLTGSAGREGSPAFSPDSGAIAYAWDGGQGGKRDIYVKRLAGGDPVRLSTSAEDEWNPAWSTDGRQVAFLRQGAGIYHVVVVPAAGGAEMLAGSIEQSMTNLPDRLSWSGELAEIVVADDPRGRNLGMCLFAINLGTGARRQLSQTGSDSADVAPRISPDRRWIAFIRVRQREDELHVMPAEGGASRVIAKGPGIRAFSWRGSDEILYGTGATGYKDRWVASVAGGIAKRPSFAMEPGVSEVDISPDGTRMAYVRKVRDSNIWQVFPGGAPRKVAVSTRADEDASFSPDGTRIAFSSDRSGEYEIWVADVTGSNVKKLTALNGYSASPSWSPDGTRIAFDSNAGGLGQVWVVSASAEGGKPVLLTPRSESIVPSWSRDGRWIYFSARSGGRNEIWRVSASGGTPQQLTRDGGFESRESADGEFLYYTNTARGGIWRLRLQEPARTEVVAPFDSAVQFRCWDLGPSGIFVGSPGVKPVLNLYPLAGGSGAPVAVLPQELPRFGRCLSAHPRGSSFLYSVDDADHQEIYLAAAP